MPSSPATTALALQDKDNKEKNLGEQGDVLQKLAAMREKLKAKGIADNELLASLQEAESAAQGPAQTQRLTHKVVTQLQKAERSKEVVRGQIKELDAKWKEWHEYMMQKHQEQRGLYMDKRKIMMERYTEARGKIAELKEEIKSVAATMAAGKEEDEVEFLNFSMQDAFVEEKIDLTGMSEDEEAEVTAVVEKPEANGEKRKPNTPTAASPSKAARTA